MSGALTDTSIVAGASNPTGYTIDQSTRWNAGDSPHLDRTPGTAGDRRTWTWSSWVKKEVDGSHKTLFSAGSGAEVMIRLRSGNQIHVLSATPGVDDTVLSLETTAQYRDPVPSCVKKIEPVWPAVRFDGFAKVMLCAIVQLK